MITYDFSAAQCVNLKLSMMEGFRFYSSQMKVFEINKTEKTFNAALRLSSLDPFRRDFGIRFNSRHRHK